MCIEALGYRVLSSLVMGGVGWMIAVGRTRDALVLGGIAAFLIALEVRTSALLSKED